ncbi:hypothetical protein V7127_09275, partial [Bacillus sp. JJ1773]|uniref:hypothetical protein n=1 Tax=Bacillus sp. JJ1773 TaxID=3122965 RepID=UPI002FFF506C
IEFTFCQQLYLTFFKYVAIHTEVVGMRGPVLSCNEGIYFDFASEFIFSITIVSYQLTNVFGN